MWQKMCSLDTFKVAPVFKRIIFAAQNSTVFGDRDTVPASEKLPNIFQSEKNHRRPVLSRGFAPAPARAISPWKGNAVKDVLRSAKGL